MDLMSGGVVFADNNYSLMSALVLIVAIMFSACALILGSRVDYGILSH